MPSANFCRELEVLDTSLWYYNSGLLFSRRGCVVWAARRPARPASPGLTGRTGSRYFARRGICRDPSPDGFAYPATVIVGFAYLVTMIVTGLAGFVRQPGKRRRAGKQRRRRRAAAALPP
jgi:hypothetical protein